MLRLCSCKIENYRALRHGTIALDSTTVLVGENGCGKSSLIHALEICLGPTAAAGEFAFAAGDFHRGPDGTQARLRIQLQFAEDGDDFAANASLWQSLRRPGLVDADGRLDFCLSVEADLEEDGPRARFFFPAAVNMERPEALLAEIRRILPFLRIRNRVAPEGNPRRGATTLSSHEELARERVERQIHASLATMVEADSVPENVVAAVRDAIREIWQRWTPVEDAELALPGDDRLMAPLSPSGTWAQMATLLQGSGARSLAMLAFAGAFLQARGPRMLDLDVRPLICIEEPETRLHPLMLTAVWSLIQRVPAQKIVTTNSADLLAAIPLGNLRRLTRDATGRAIAYSVPADGMTLEELRRVAYHLRVRRGTALFMRFWLLVEGETEYWLLPEIARVMGIDLRQEGIECLEFAQSGLAPLARLANHLGIGWHLLCDGDGAGQSYWRKASDLAHPTRSRLTVLPTQDIEHCLWHHGYSHVFLKAAGMNPRAAGRRKPRDVIDQAVKTLSKPGLALLLGEAMRVPDAPGVPPVLEVVVRSAVHWAVHGRFPDL